MKHRRSLAERAPFLAALPMLAILAVPLIALAGASSPGDIAAGARHPLFAPALWLSTRTTLFSLWSS
ncbi:MAG: molybdate ABC transporter permease subunit, partial [Gemmatimonadetes bacterium]|nr:molybdate ABC transporter permease subunit [Gemmatimonadota bacterium]